MSDQAHDPGFAEFEDFVRTVLKCELSTIPPQAQITLEAAFFGGQATALRHSYEDIERNVGAHVERMRHVLKPIAKH